MTQTLAEKVRIYIERAARADKHDNAKLYPLDEVALYTVMGGNKSEFSYARRDMGVFKGRFIDVVAAVAGSSEFYGFWSDDPGHSGDGYIVKTGIQEAKPVEGLVECINKAREIEQRRAELKAQLDEVEKAYAKAMGESA
jgi:hypothetical protein